MDKRELKLLAVTKGDSDLDKTLVFVDEVNGGAFEKRVRLGAYDETTKKTVADAEKAEKTEKQMQEFFGVSFEDLDMAIDNVVELFVKDGNIFFEEFFIADKPTALDKGELYTFQIDTITDKDDLLEIIIIDEDNDKKYILSGFRYTKKVGEEYLKFDAHVLRAHEKFEKLFKISLDELVDAKQFEGVDILVECGEYGGHKFITGKKVVA